MYVAVYQLTAARLFNSCNPNEFVKAIWPLFNPPFNFPEASDLNEFDILKEFIYEN